MSVVGNREAVEDEIEAETEVSRDECLAHSLSQADSTSRPAIAHRSPRQDRVCGRPVPGQLEAVHRVSPERDPEAGPVGSLAGLASLVMSQDIGTSEPPVRGFFTF